MDWSFEITDPASGEFMVQKGGTQLHGKQLPRDDGGGRIVDGVVSADYQDHFVVLVTLSNGKVARFQKGSGRLNFICMM